MATKTSARREIHLRLIHDGAQPGALLTEPLRFGLQDTDGEVRPGVPRSDGALRFDFALEIKGEPENGQPVFKGAFAHGPPASRFVYLSWKRLGTHEHPWGWRIKMPLSGIGWREIREALDSGACLVADVRGRRPHASQPIEWKVAPLEDA